MPRHTSTELVSIFREDYVSVAVYRNIVDDQTYYDIVISRLIWEKSPGAGRRRMWKRGANLKPGDLPKLTRLLGQVQELLDDEPRLKDTKPDMSQLA